MKTIRTGLTLSAILIIFLGAFAFARQPDYPKAPYYQRLGTGEFPIMATYAFYEPLITPQQFQWVKEAGFNVISQNLSVADFEKCLELAKEYGLRVRAITYDQSKPSKIPGFVAKFKDNPVLFGYRGKDEPNVTQFDSLARLQATYQKLDPKSNIFINLLPAVGAKQLGAPDYKTYVEEYVRTVNPPFISYDCYPIKEDKAGNIYVDNIFYRTIEVVSDISKKSERPFWAFILCVQHMNYPKPTKAFLRFQMFSNLAYGAQGILYFTYQLPDYDRGKNTYSNSPIDSDGNRTDVWYMVRDVNRELINLQNIFLDSEVLDVSLTGQKIPDGSHRLKTLPAPFRILETGEEGVIVSHLRKDGHEYLMLVNRDVVNKQKVRLSRTREVVRILPTGKEKYEKSANVTLDPGGLALYRVK